MMDVVAADRVEEAIETASVAMATVTTIIHLYEFLQVIGFSGSRACLPSPPCSQSTTYGSSSVPDPLYGSLMMADQLVTYRRHGLSFSVWSSEIDGRRVVEEAYECMPSAFSLSVVIVVACVLLTVAMLLRKAARRYNCFCRDDGPMSKPLTPAHARAIYDRPSENAYTTERVADSQKTGLNCGCLQDRSSW